MNLRPIIIPCLLLLTLVCQAQTPEELIEQFFVEYKAQGAEVSLNTLYDTNPWISNSSDAIINLKTQMKGLTEELVGPFYGKELIVKRSIGESYVLYSYMAKFDRQPLRFTFEFYKPKDKWILFGFLFDDNLDDELEESAKIHMIKSTYNN